MKSIQVKWLLIAIIGILSIVSVTLCYRLKKLNDTIHNLYLSNSSNDIKQINSLIFESHFKDDLVLSNFNTSTTIIITFFTIIIALGGYLSFNKINEEIKDLKNLKQEVEEAQSKIEKTSIEVKETKSQIIDTSKRANTTNTNIQKLHTVFLKSNATLIYTELTLNTSNINFYCKEKNNKPFDYYFIYNTITNSVFKLQFLKALNIENQPKNLDKTYQNSNKELIKTFNILYTFLSNNKLHISDPQAKEIPLSLEKLTDYINQEDHPDILNGIDKIVNLFKLEE